MPIGALREIDMRLIDDLFGMGGGYVLDFTDRTFGSFFRDDLGIDIDHARFRMDGTSKAKRLRCLLKTSDSPTRVRVLKALWEYRSFQQRRNRQQEDIPHAGEEFRRLIERIEGRTPQPEPK